jgi:hypothetical protein
MKSREEEEKREGRVDLLRVWWCDIEAHPAFYRRSEAFANSSLWRAVPAMLLHDSEIVGDQFEIEGSMRAAKVNHSWRR